MGQTGRDKAGQEAGLDPLSAHASAGLRSALFYHGAGQDCHPYYECTTLLRRGNPWWSSLKVSFLSFFSLSVSRSESKTAMLSRIPTAWRRKKINQSDRGSCLEILNLETDSNLFQPRLPLKTGASGHIIWTIEPALMYTEAGGQRTVPHIKWTQKKSDQLLVTSSVHQILVMENKNSWVSRETGWEWNRGHGGFYE